MLFLAVWAALLFAVNSAEASFGDPHAVGAKKVRHACALSGRLRKMANEEEEILEDTLQFVGGDAVDVSAFAVLDPLRPEPLANVRRALPLSKNSKPQQKDSSAKRTEAERLVASVVGATRKKAVAGRRPPKCLRARPWPLKTSGNSCTRFFCGYPAAPIAW
ncbi:hypothetical protein ERJ75_000517500 [Trypanosoma vivax]|nr:hypothetical protein ERJ75_000517500 [Trypanosoma vivax]